MAVYLAMKDPSVPLLPSQSTLCYSPTSESWQCHDSGRVGLISCAFVYRRCLYLERSGARLCRCLAAFSVPKDTSVSLVGYEEGCVHVGAAVAIAVSLACFQHHPQLERAYAHNRLQLPCICTYMCTLPCTAPMHTCI